MVQLSRKFIKFMKTDAKSYLLSALSVVVFSGASLASNFTRSKPIVAYSERSICPTGVHDSYFDLTYFNSEIPIGSIVSLRFGFEHENSCRCRSTFLTAWNETQTIAMKQWEQFGWYTRISSQVACGMNQFLLSGIDFVIEIQSPNGDVLLEPAPTQGYYRATKPDFSNCQSAEGIEPKTCPADVQWVNSP